jgi:hypothetical protein
VLFIGLLILGQAPWHAWKKNSLKQTEISTGIYPLIMEFFQSISPYEKKFLEVSRIYGMIAYGRPWSTKFHFRAIREGFSEFVYIEIPGES